MSETFEELFDGLYPDYKVFITPSGRSLKYDMRELWDARQQKIDKLERDNEVLKEACEFYAEPENWDEELMEGDFCNEFMLTKETGKRARQALSDTNNDKGEKRCNLQRVKEKEH